MTGKFVISLSVLINLSCLPVLADDTWSESSESDEWEQAWPDESGRAISWQGFAELAYGSRLQTDPLFSNRLVLGDFRVHLEADLDALNGRWQLQTDGSYDAVLERWQGELREFSYQASPLYWLDISVGKQVFSWGTGEFVFVNDLFAKDWQALFSGREDSYLKSPQHAIRLDAYAAEGWNTSLIWMPEFTPDKTISGERFSYFNPLQGEQSVTPANVTEPDIRLRNGELALRVQNQVGSVELATYGHYGFSPSPVFDTALGTLVYDRLSAIGASVITPLGSGLLNAELGLHRYAQTDDQWRGLLGYQRELLAGFSLGVQYYLERTTAALVDKNRHLVTTRFSLLTNRDRLRWSLFTFASPDEQDHYLRQQVSWRVNDDVQLTGGINLFDGEPQGFFGQFDASTNAWIRGRYSF